jgi:hypothetical protein
MMNAHDEWSIGDLLHWLNYPSLPITFPCFESRSVLIFKCSPPEYSWKIVRWSQCNRSPMDHSSWAFIMSIMFIMSCYTGFFNVRRGWQSLNTGPRFYLRLIRRTGWLWIYTSCTTDGRPFKPKKLSVPFLYPGVPVGLTPFRGLGQRNLVPILPPAHPLGGGCQMDENRTFRCTLY